MHTKKNRMMKNWIKIVCLICCISAYTFSQTNISGINTSIEPSANGVTITGAANGICYFETHDVATTCLEEITRVPGYTFFINSEGNLMYGNASYPCTATELSCIELCSIYERDFNDVLAASANVFTNQWNINDDVKNRYGLSSTNPIETAEEGKWYLQSTYTYKTDISRMDEDNNMSFTSGILNDFYPFNWNNPDNIAEHWLKTNTLTEYTPDGKLLESENILGTFGTEKLGYKNTLPYLTANNAEYESVLFESFEYNYGSSKCGDTYCFEEIGYNDHHLSSDYAHTGEYSTLLGLNSSSTSTGNGLAITYTNNYTGSLVLAQNKELTDAIQNSGLVVKMWLRYSGTSALTLSLADYTTNVLDENAETNNTDGMALTDNDSPKFNDISFEEIARAGEWTLYQAVINPNDWASSANSYFGMGSGSADTDYGLEINVQLSTTSSIINVTGETSPSIYIDDVRVEPLNAKMAAYVYDPNTFRVVASLDDQNFALIYQYNDEGKLVRKQKETIEGVKTIVETQYNIPTESR